MLWVENAPCLVFNSFLTILSEPLGGKEESYNLLRGWAIVLAVCSPLLLRCNVSARERAWELSRASWCWNRSERRQPPALLWHWTALYRANRGCSVGLQENIFSATRSDNVCESLLKTSEGAVKKNRRKRGWEPFCHRCGCDVSLELWCALHCRSKWVDFFLLVFRNWDIVWVRKRDLCSPQK